MGKPELTRHSQAHQRRNKLLQTERESFSKLLEPRFAPNEQEIRLRRKVRKRSAFIASIQRERNNFEKSVA